MKPFQCALRIHLRLIGAHKHRQSMQYVRDILDIPVVWTNIFGHLYKQRYLFVGILGDNVERCMK